jgi:Ca-activated chloride channel homolog
MKKLILSVFFLVTFYLSADILNYDKVLSNLKGVKYYNKEDYGKADSLFNENSINYPNDSRLHYNQGNAKYKNGQLEDAEYSYNLALKNNEFEQRSEALQNLGNVKFQQKDYQNAIKNYRDSLVENPENMDARFNYELAARMLQRQQEQQQNQQQESDKDNEEEKDKQDQQQQQKQDEQKQDEKQEEKEQQQQEEEKSEEQKQQKKQQMKEEAKKKEDAEKILKALLQKEKEEMKKEKQKMNVDKEKTGKYW